MSKEALAKVVQRAISDGAFRRQLSSDPATALRGFDLTSDEAAAIRSGDAGRLTAMGVELRMSKAFTLSSDSAPNAGGNSVLSNDLGASYTGAVVSGANAGIQSGVNSALLSGSDMGVQSGANSALLSGSDMGVQSGTNNALISGDITDNDAILSAGTNAGRDEVVIPGEPAHALGAADDANAEGFLTGVHTSGDNAFNPTVISTEGPGTASVLTAGDGISANADLTDANAEGFLTSVNTGGDNATDSILVVDDNAVSGAASPGEASEGPNISQ